MKKKAIIITVISLCILLIGALTTRISYVYFNTKSWTNLILPGIKINNVDVSGKNRNEAVELLKSKYGNEVLKKKVIIKAAGKEYVIDYLKLNAKYNIEEAVNEALNYGTSLGMFKKYSLIKNPVEKNTPLKFAFDQKAVKDTIAVMEKEINRNPVNAAISMSTPGKFTVTPDKKGAKLQTENLEKDILSKINGELSSDVEIQAPVEVLTAAVTAEKLNSVNSKISSYSTDFSTSSQERASNIALSTKSINGTLLMPGESFSFNGVVGERTAGRGYKDAPVIIGNKIESGIGGGICQVSSTLHNAVLRTDIKSIERVHHTMPSSYVPKGLDATVDWGNIDYKFTNTLQYPIYIEGYTVNRTLYFNIYSDSSLTARKYEVYSEVYETLPAGVQEIKDATLEEGVRVPTQKPYNGYRVKVYKKTIENGQVLSTEVIATDFYKKIDAIVKVGTKKKAQ